jgi:hypothetical protein
MYLRGHGQRKTCDRTGVLTTDQGALGPRQCGEETPSEGPGRPTQNRFGGRLGALSIKRNSEDPMRLDDKFCAASITNELCFAQTDADCVEGLHRKCTVHGGS